MACSKDAKVVDKEVFDLVADVEKAYDTCNRFKKPKLRPVVRFALAETSMTYWQWT